jgi:LAO/AO transport system kinase
MVLCAPGLGDDVQALKSGVLEIADLLVVNKADLPGAQETVAQLRGAAALSGRERPVLTTSSTRGEGIAELVDACLSGPAADAAARDPERRLRHVLAKLAGEQARARIQSDDNPDVAALCRAVRRGELDLDTAARRALERVRG